ncbi:Uncharacterised protein [Vibrio cholerae]|nr:Uncharacterised protein [Vibrio cholerae]CSC96717.1 Uncharacterised protein [Vibrio cholerae]CSI83915.1 Uncharacterised protein [Vibrio cholerae]CSI87036.1 Uncharacterised protein [Vibrio cholerae]
MLGIAGKQFLDNAVCLSAGLGAFERFTHQQHHMLFFADTRMRLRLPFRDGLGEW